MLGSSGRPVWILVHEGQEERQAGRQALQPGLEEEGQQKISSPSADASDVRPSPG